jgi:hypothetical protein
MRDTLFAFKIILGVLWPVTTYAANLSFGSGMIVADPWAIAMALILSSMAGLTALLSQMKKDYEANGKIDRLWLYISAKMSGSNVAGLAAYFGADSLNFGSSQTAAAIIVAAFGGTWALERVLEWAAEKWFPTKVTNE